MDKVQKMFFLLIPLVFHSCAAALSSSSYSDVDKIEKHLTEITKAEDFRNYENIQALNKTAAYIKQEFLAYCDSVAFQPYKVNDVEYKNVIGSFGIQNEERIIIGAHYDVAGDQEGADDNASGVVGLLELARLFSSTELKYQIDLVAYTLEEPPFFRTEHMGSFIHAEFLRSINAQVKGYGITVG